MHPVSSRTAHEMSQANGNPGTAHHQSGRPLRHSRAASLASAEAPVGHMVTTSPVRLSDRVESVFLLEGELFFFFNDVRGSMQAQGPLFLPNATAVAGLRQRLSSLLRGVCWEVGVCASGPLCVCYVRRLALSSAA
jgi:hypothetical protein